MRDLKEVCLQDTGETRVRTRKASDHGTTVNEINGKEDGEQRELRASVNSKFDGHCDHWSMLMKNLLCSKEYWSNLENRITSLPVAVTPEQIKNAEECKLKDLKAKNNLF